MKKLAAALAVAALAAVATPARADSPVKLSLAPALPDLSLQLALSQAGTATRADRPRTIFGLPRNMGTADRVIRGALAVGLASVASYRLSEGSPNEGLSWALLGASAIPAATGAVGYCPLYHPFGIDTN
jgi:hypothetical protein